YFFRLATFSNGSFMLEPPDHVSPVSHEENSVPDDHPLSPKAPDFRLYTGQMRTDISVQTGTPVESTLVSVRFRESNTTVPSCRTYSEPIESAPPYKGAVGDGISLSHFLPRPLFQHT